ncbi:alpha-amylase family glycosyl hydrolase [Silanimonas sp.]|uniref:alpha-amylase family glycosyl hydrolase n=1 Tax=Silanimonas sp. TaxID=1929290 RepID=UPI0037C9B80B
MRTGTANASTGPTPDPGWAARQARFGPRLEAALASVYGALDPAWYARLVDDIAERAAARPAALRALDADAPRAWLTDPETIGYCTYVDRFGGTLAGVARRADHLEALGVRYLHLLPFLAMREGDSDGGFAVRDYGDVEPRLGTMADLEALAATLRPRGIHLCADFVLNHCSDDHAWAKAARAGDPFYHAFFHVLPDEAAVARHEAHLGQVFPRTAPGNFTFVSGLGHVWTTFYPYQWDLNWSNPEVFRAMALALLDLANRGVECFRLDSTAFLWKREGTPCMNLPEAHQLLQALRAVVDLAMPSVVLKAEAIVPMRELPPYFGTAGAPECHIAYQSSLMAAGWAGLALGRADLVANVLKRTPTLPDDATWLHYVRCHDDIVWPVLDDEAAGRSGVPSFDLAALSRHYAGDAPGSTARGEAFQSDGGHAHGSNGMASALAGLDWAHEHDDEAERERALRRVLLLYGIAMVLPGIPLIYMGDELAQGNDESFRADPERRHEGRWLHRPALDNAAAAQRHDPTSDAGRVFGALRGMRQARAMVPALADRAVDAGAHGPVLTLARGTGLFAAFNLGGDGATVTLPGGRWRRLAIDGCAPANDDAAVGDVHLSAYDQGWWVPA